MTYQEAVAEYGSAANVARILGITRQAVGQWQRFERIPNGMQCRLQVISAGRLMADLPAANNIES